MQNLFMSLNLEKLEKVRKLDNGIVQTRCPACAESGADRTGEHLRIYPDGRFGCCVHPKDRAHRKRIFALAGVHKRQEIRVQIATPQAAKMIQPEVLGRLGRVFASGPAPNATTGGTVGTIQYSYMCEKNNYMYIRKDYRSGVLNVPEQQEAEDCDHAVPAVPMLSVAVQSGAGVPSVPAGAVLPESPGSVAAVPSSGGERLPYLTAGGTLVIPFNSPERYHWWKPDGERLTVEQTMQEVRAALASQKG